MKSVTVGTCALALAILTEGCAGPTEGEVQFQVIEETDFAAVLSIRLSRMQRLPSGVYIRDIIPGTGATAEVGMRVTVEYGGWLSDGTQFYGSVLGAPDQFTLGVDDPVPGFRDGIAGMRVGGAREFIVPPELGYGARSASGVPPGSVLVYQAALGAVN